MECHVCGISYRKERLLEAISGNGIVKICFDCSRKENLPVLRKPTTFQLKESERKPTPIPFKVQSSFQKPRTDLADTELKDLVNKNYISKSNFNKKPRPDLVGNFHWTLMRARRSKKMTIGQLAKEISESEVAIKMAEKGVLPEDDYRLISKLESFLGVKIVKDLEKSKKENREIEVARVLSFDSASMKNLTIDDMKKLKQQRELEVFSPQEMEGDEVIIVGDDEVLSDEEIDDILFRG